MEVVEIGGRSEYLRPKKTLQKVEKNRLLSPAVPTDWKDIEFRDLRAEGAFLVSARREHGNTMWVRIKSLAGESCQLLTDIKGEVQAMGGRPFKLEKGAPGTYRIDLRKGEEGTLCSGSANDPGK